MEFTCKPDSVRNLMVSPWSFILGNHYWLPRAIYPGFSDEQSISLLDLAPGGVYLASSVTTGAVGSYPAVSPLPEISHKSDFFRRSILCGTFHRSPGVRVTDHPALWSPDFPLTYA